MGDPFLVLIVIVFQTLPSGGARPLRPLSSLDNAIILVLTESDFDPDVTDTDLVN